MKTYKSDVRQAIHEMAFGLHRAGVIDDAAMREYDESCLRSVSGIDPEEVRSIRDEEQMTQEGLALHLGVQPSLVGEWERGESTPDDAAIKLLDLVRRKGIDAIR